MSKNVIRVAVGTPDAHGPTWRIWHSGARDDVYVGTRGTAGAIKVSLHASGDFRMAFTVEHVESDDALVTMDKRMIKRWRPVEILSGAWRTVTILEPWFSATESYALKPNVSMVPAAPHGSEKVLVVVVTRAGVEFVDSASPTGMPLGPVELPSGARAWVLVREQEIPDEVLKDMNRKRRVTVTRDGDVQSGIRLMLLGVDEAGIGYVRDVPADPDATPT